MRIIAIILVLVGLVAGGAAIYTKWIGTEPANNYRTAEVKRGDLVLTVNATGTLEPEERVDVGAQIVGPVLSLGPDPRGISDPALRPKTIDYDPAFKDKHIDWGSPVEEGTVLAVIDPAVYQAQYDQAEATLQRANADLGELIAHRDQAEADWKRAQTLRNVKLPNLSPTGSKLDASATEPIKAISDSDYDQAKANYAVAKANVDVGQATIVQAQAALKLAKTNLGYTTITSPVKGTIIDRRVDVGQTVVATFSAQSLFLIGKDLSRLEVWTSVNEADIGRLRLGMPVAFQVEAFPDETFHGTVSQIRLNAQSNQNVVTYTVVVSTENPDMKLKPYLTTDPVKFEVEKHSDVLLVPNAALRWNPRPEQIAPDAREALKTAADKETDSSDKEGAAKGEKAASADTEKLAAADSTANAKTGSPGSDPTAKQNDANAKGGQGNDQPDKAAKKAEAHARRMKNREERGTLWVKDGNFVRPLAVHKGDSDDQDTEITGDGVQAGLEVVAGEVHATDQTGETNPFAPQFFRGNRQGQKGGDKGGDKGGKGAK